MLCQPASQSKALAPVQHTYKCNARELTYTLRHRANMEL